MEELDRVAGGIVEQDLLAARAADDVVAEAQPRGSQPLDFGGEVKEVKRRADVVGIFPDEAAILRLVGAVLIEAHDEWAIAERRYLSEGSMAAILAGGKPSGMASDTPALLAS